MPGPSESRMCRAGARRLIAQAVEAEFETFLAAKSSATQDAKTQAVPRARL